jgi:hypothetical protein
MRVESEWETHLFLALSFVVTVLLYAICAQSLALVISHDDCLTLYRTCSWMARRVRLKILL